MRSAAGAPGPDFGTRDTTKASLTVCNPQPQFFQDSLHKITAICAIIISKSKKGPVLKDRAFAFPRIGAQKVAFSPAFHRNFAPSFQQKFTRNRMNINSL
jgi:hypothetical protein